MPDLKLATRWIACELCDSTESAAICQNDGLQVSRCLRCDLVFVNPQPTYDALREYHASSELMHRDGWSSYFQHGEEQIRELWQERLEEVRRWEPGGDVRLLDVGCGCGDFLHLARQAGWQVCGFEFSQAVADVARQRYGLTVAVGDISELAFTENSFDMITSWHVLEHLCNPLLTLRRIYKLLRERGVLVLEVPNLHWIVRKSYRFPLSTTLHLFHFTPSTLTRLVQMAGFEVLECGHGNTGFLYPSRRKVCAKKCLYAISRTVHRLSGINVGDSIRLYARRKD